MLFASCDLILKPREKDNEVDVTEKKVVLGTDKDDKGCVTSAGYMWSEIRKNCIRVFEEGYRLEPYISDTLTVAEDGEQATLNAYVIFSEDQNQAELFLPTSSKSIILNRKSEGSPYANGEWMLEAWKGYVLKKGAVIQYVSAVPHVKKFVGSDKVEQ
jgi:hypothetical protein